MINAALPGFEKATCPVKRGVGLAVTYTDQPESADLYKWWQQCWMLQLRFRTYPSLGKGFWCLTYSTTCLLLGLAVIIFTFTFRYWLILIYFLLQMSCVLPHYSPLGSGPALLCWPWWPISCDRPFEAFNPFPNLAPLAILFDQPLLGPYLPANTFSISCLSLLASLTFLINRHHAGFDHQLGSIFPFFCFYFVPRPLSLHSQRWLLAYWGGQRLCVVGHLQSEPTTIWDHSPAHQQHSPWPETEWEQVESSALQLHVPLHQPNWPEPHQEWNQLYWRWSFCRAGQPTGDNNTYYYYTLQFMELV